MRTKLTIAILFGMMFAFISRIQAAEYFVTKQGSDANLGASRELAFQTIQKGVDVLQPGDTLTIGPGEYFEAVCRTNLGSMAVDTVIRSEIPGAAVMRGDVPAPEFKKVDGYRFVYAAPFDQIPQAVLEHHTGHTFFPKPSPAELEFNPGFFHYDTHSQTLYISNPDLSPPTGRRYTVAVKDVSGLQLYIPQRVRVEGLAATGFHPNWGISMFTPNTCVVRDCIAFMNVGGINLCPTNGIGGNGGPNNLIESCVAFGNTFAGIARYGANNDIIRNCHLFKNVREGNEHFGIIHYGGMHAPLLMTNNISWGHNFNYSVKPRGLERLERNVALGYIRIVNMAHNIVAGGNEYDGASAQTADNVLFRREQNLDRDFEYADPLNLDFRLQPDSRFRKGIPDGTDRGPYPYTATVFYLATDGDDEADGLSMRKPWRTLARALPALRSGDSVYLAEGSYAAATWKSSGDGEAPIRIAGRGRGSVVITNRFAVADGVGLAFERLVFADGVTLNGGQDLAFNNCTFYGSSGGLEVNRVNKLKITHSVFKEVPLQLSRTQNASLSGNLYANSGGPAVLVDAEDAVIYSDYNSYQDASRCWRIGRGGWSCSRTSATLSLTGLQPQQDQYSRMLKPEFSMAQDGTPYLENADQFKSLGPHSTTLGVHHDYHVTAESISLVGPFVHSAQDSTANIEWWSSHPASYTLCWGDTPEMTNATRTVNGPERFNTFSLTDLKPSRKYYFSIRSVAATGRDAAEPLPGLRPDNASVSFITASAPAAPKVYYVAPDGDDKHDGLSRAQAFQTANRAAFLVGPGDTVMIAGGAYSETVRIRAAGTKDRPITFRAIVGEKPVFAGENVSLVFQVVSKPDIRFDGLYFGAGFWDKVMVIRQSPRVQVTRCFNVMIGADECPDMLVRNCVVRGGWSGLGLSRSPDSLVENNVFIMTILRHIEGDSLVARNNIFCECIRNKAHQTLVSLGQYAVESNNCFYVRWPEDEKLAINWRPLTEYRLRTGSDTFAANPMMPGISGMSQGWQATKVENFDDCFAANPELILRGIGLQPEAFRTFNLSVTNWPFTPNWAKQVIAATNVTGKLVQAGNNAAALIAFTNLAATVTLPERLKAEILEQASLCAERLKDYTLSMDLAKKIPVQPIAMRRQMQLMLAQGKYGEVIDNFNSKKLGGRSFHQSYTYPEQEDLMADLYYLRSRAYIQTNDLVAAEADLKIMNDKRAQLSYRSGEAIHDLSWLRLGDFYRDQLKDDNRAYSAYTNIFDRTTWSPFGRPRKPASTGASATLVAATQSVSDILRKLGREKEVPQLQYNLLLAQAEAAAAVLKGGETIAKFREILAMPGKSSAGIEAVEKRINALPDEVKTNTVKAVGALVSGLLDDTRDLLIKGACEASADNRAIALRSLLLYAPADKVNELLNRVEADLKKKTIQAQLEPIVKRLRELAQARKWQEIADQFKDTAFSAWQDNDLAGEAFNIRGTAYYSLKVADKAEADLKKGLEKKPGDLIAWYFLAENYRENIKNDDKALEAYQKLVGQGNWHMPTEATLKAAEILRARGKNQEALKIIETFTLDTADGSWREKKLSAFESTLLALNKKQEAIAKYHYVLTLKNLTPAERSGFEKRIKMLQGEDK